MHVYKYAKWHGKQTAEQSLKYTHRGENIRTMREFIWKKHRKFSVRAHILNILNL